MKPVISILVAAGLLAAAAPAFAEANAAVAVSAGKMLYDSKGQRIASIYRVAADGNPQVVLNGRLITVPAATLSQVNGKVTTSLSRSDLTRAK